ncbi:cell division protein ftsZ [Thecamonas trahens ATCC 50062]|uniref:Cell division protein ftsZ n=1 Tax=Thecamonas trahens ATCC 50062 TaxID=461836 RepID=A0A0L0DY44_THETB|nr:cell division protein ftsZ [Thecamonas trahens ATCC 50062]KNC56478.1 cell division protein ftsZ [Thecamonas trahens ATCC 50062]|eukprot:XP_013760987.1 cell division protein ftsZ [Thecamonas trahens ATCC 50062]
MGLHSAASVWKGNGKAKAKAAGQSSSKAAEMFEPAERSSEVEAFLAGNFESSASEGSTSTGSASSAKDAGERSLPTPPTAYAADPPADYDYERPKISVVGVGGAGGNAVNNMILSQLEGVDFVVCNTDNQALSQAATDARIQLGSKVTRGLGAGANPDIGREAALESMPDILAAVGDANMVFITAGMGGGTGTGAAPEIARHIASRGVLTVGVVTLPFDFEGRNRQRLALEGLAKLEESVDTLIVIPNQKLMTKVTARTSLRDAFGLADFVLQAGVRSVTDLMVMPGLINLDFADVRAVMWEQGRAMMGSGQASGESRAVDAASAAISNDLLADSDLSSASGMLINIAGSTDMTLWEINEAAKTVQEVIADDDANIIFGSTYDANLPEDTVRVSVVATGIGGPVSLNLRSTDQWGNERAAA